MKKLISILTVICLFVVSVNAQFLSSSLIKTNTISDNSSLTYSIENAVVGYWYINAPKDYATAQMVSVELDSIAGNHTNVAVQLYGRYNSYSAWATIGSAVNWTGATADTTFNIVNTTENGYREFKLLFTGTGTGETQISTLFFKQWFGNF